MTPPKVADALNGKANSLDPYTSPWPADINTNFRFSFVDYTKLTETNYGHSEYQLLTDNALEKMANSKNVGCSQYVILYSSNLLCYKPANPGPEIPRCAQLTIQAKNDFAKTSPGATFYLYNDYETGKKLKDQKKLDFLMNSGIVWIHEDMDSPLA